MPYCPVLIVGETCTSCQITCVNMNLKTILGYKLIWALIDKLQASNEMLSKEILVN